MKRLLIVLTLTLAGCATTENYKAILDTWVGAEEIDLVRSWGAPDQAYDSSGVRFLTYNSSRNIHIPGTIPTYTSTVYGNTIYTTSSGGSAPIIIHEYCRTTFESKGSVIVSWRFSGNDCTALKSE